MQTCCMHARGASQPANTLRPLSTHTCTPSPATTCLHRYQKSYRELAKKHPDFRQRSETTELIVEISLQPFESFKPDGVILFSDILTPLPALGVEFEIDDAKGPILENTIRSMDQVKKLHAMDFSKVEFVGRCAHGDPSSVPGCTYSRGRGG
jgi:uroporphyrinogen-III decarboxylase